MDTGGRHPDPLLIASLGVFRSLSFPECERLASLMAEAEVEPGEVINAEGDAGGRFFVVVEGDAEVVKGGALLRRLGPGDHFGEIALLSDGPRTASVIAASPMRVLVMFGTAFRMMEQEFPTVAKAVYVDAAHWLDEDDAR